jgi:hypothetical protein
MRINYAFNVVCKMAPIYQPTSKNTETCARVVRVKNIMDLHHKGIATAVIANIVDLTPRSVQRIIRVNL